ncbi:ethanolamine utilization protein EutH [Escherichia coli]|uniref:ethanolamine utilization protein EutH n=1 Tax=Escherichia coli TaxID=562 RepID=UPI003D77D3B0
MKNIAAAGMVATLAKTSDVRHDEADGYPRQSHQLRLRRFRCFRLGDHLGFAAANMNAMIFPMIVGKLIGRVTAIGVAMMLVPKEDATATKTEAEAQS